MESSYLPGRKQTLLVKKTDLSKKVAASTTQERDMGDSDRVSTLIEAVRSLAHARHTDAFS